MSCQATIVIIFVDGHIKFDIANTLWTFYMKKISFVKNTR